jgi:hypothetical protein
MADCATTPDSTSAFGDGIVAQDIDDGAAILEIS